jgi:hypothetical protein
MDKSDSQITYTLFTGPGQLPQTQYDGTPENTLVGLIISHAFFADAFAHNKNHRKSATSDKLPQFRKDERLLRQTLAGIEHFILRYAAGYEEIKLTPEQKQAIIDKELHVTKSVTENENENGISSQNL